MSNRTRNYYDELNVKNDCKPEDIKKSFIKLSKKFHPDKNSSKDAHEMFVRINEAYSTLSNPFKRKQYDHDLSVRKSYDFRKENSTTYGSYRNHNYTHHQHSHRTDSKNSYSGSRFLLRLILLPKAFLVTALVFMTFLSSGLEFYFLRSGFERRKNIMDNKSIMACVILEEARRQAELLGIEEQMKRLKEGKLGVYDNDVLIQEYIKAKNSQRYKSK